MISADDLKEKKLPNEFSGILFESFFFFFEATKARDRRWEKNDLKMQNAFEKFFIDNEDV